MPKNQEKQQSNTQQTGNKIDPTESKSGEVVPGSVRVQPEEMSQKRESTPSSKPDVDAETHMGASEDQIIQNKPPTGALSDVLDDKPENKRKDQHNPAPNDELTPG